MHRASNAPGDTYFRKLRSLTDGAVGAYAPGKVSEAITQHMTPLIAGWSGAHFQRVAASISANPTQAEFDQLLDDHDDVAGNLAARFPSKLSFSLLSDSRRRQDYSNTYVAEMLALRALMPVNAGDRFKRKPNGLYPVDGRIGTALDIMDQGLESTLFDVKTHDAIKGEMLLWKLIFLLSTEPRIWGPQKKISYEEAKFLARAVLTPLGMSGGVDQIEGFHEVNALYRM